MLLQIHFFPGLCLLLLGLWLQNAIVRRLWDNASWPRAAAIGVTFSTIVLSLGYLLEFQRVSRLFPVWWATWLECAALVETMGLIGLYCALLLQRHSPEFQSARRSFLRAAGGGLCVAPVIATGFGILHRNRFQVSEVDIPIPNLPKDLQGLRIVQVTDIHLSPFLSEREFSTAIDMANETRANLALVTGDLISRRGDPLDACIHQLSRLRADAGVLGCLGNHEVYANTENYVTSRGREIGIDFLRGQARVLRFGDARINFAGVDYQRYGFPYLVNTEPLIVPGVTNVLLSHNPDVFPVAAGQGFDLTIAGHTHGGQVDFEILHQHWNVARYYTPYVRGLYRSGKSAAYVSTGLGTIGVPVRIGAPPEISVLRLCAI